MNVAILAGAAFSVFGIYMFLHAISSYKRSVASMNWPDVNGRLTDVRLWGKRNIDGEMKDSEKLVVEYEYKVDGREYTGRSAAFYTLMYPETLAFAERHSANSEIKVFYNPADPAECVLIPGRNKDKPYSDLILGFLGIVVGVVIAMLGWVDVIG